MIKDLSYYWHKKTILSFLAIVFVVIIHNSTTNQYILTEDPLTIITNIIHNFFAYGLGSVAVPIFFLIAGISLFRNYKPNMYTSKLRSRIKSLLVPYLIWNIIGLLFCILCTYTPLADYISNREAFEPTLPNILSGIFLYKYNYPFWFLFELIIFVIFTPLFDFLTSRKFLSYITFLVILILPVFVESFLDLNLYFVIFYFLGCHIGRYYLGSAAKPSKKNISIISGLILLILSIIKTLPIYGIIDLPVIVSQLILILMVLSAWSFADLFIHKKKPLKFTKESFPVYALHAYFLAIIIKIIYLVAPHTSYMLLINEILSTTITVIITTGIAYFWHQKLPKSYAFFFGRS